MKWLINKLMSFFCKLPGHPKKEAIEAWPFPVVLGTPPASSGKPKRKRVAVPKATTRKVVAKKTVAKKTTKAKKK